MCLNIKLEVLPISLNFWVRLVSALYLGPSCFRLSLTFLPNTRMLNYSETSGKSTMRSETRASPRYKMKRGKMSKKSTSSVAILPTDLSDILSCLHAKTLSRYCKQIMLFSHHGPISSLVPSSWNPTTSFSFPSCDSCSICSGHDERWNPSPTADVRL